MNVFCNASESKKKKKREQSSNTSLAPASLNWGGKLPIMLHAFSYTHRHACGLTDGNQSSSSSSSSFFSSSPPGQRRCGRCSLRTGRRRPSQSGVLCACGILYRKSMVVLEGMDGSVSVSGRLNVRGEIQRVPLQLGEGDGRML